MRKVAFSLGVVLLCVGAAFSSTSLPPPDAGVSESQLAAMGENAAPFLIGRLGDRKNERYFHGIVFRLSGMALESGPDQRIYRAFRDFVELNSGRAKVPFETRQAMSHALRAIGYADGKDGVAYLINWVRTGHLNVKCADRKGRVQANAATLRDAAIVGLGLSGDSEANRFLEEQAATSPDVPYKGSFMGAIEEAQKYAKAVRAKGVKEVLRPKVNKSPTNEREPSNDQPAH